jgi:hypothetical protein
MGLSEKYRALSPQQLLEKAHELGIAYERYSGSCSQCTVAALSVGERTLEATCFHERTTP